MGNASRHQHERETKQRDGISSLDCMFHVGALLYGGLNGENVITGFLSFMDRGWEFGFGPL